MTRKDYSVIQRKLGYIEGVLSAYEDDFGALDCIRTINLILDKEKLTDEFHNNIIYTTKKYEPYHV